MIFCGAQQGIIVIRPSDTHRAERRDEMAVDQMVVDFPSGQLLGTTKNRRSLKQIEGLSAKDDRCSLTTRLCKGV